MAGGVHINKQAIAKMSRDLEREFAKHPVRVPLTMETPNVESLRTGDVYNGPVVHIHGDGAQVAWNNENVTQTNSTARQEVTPGFEPIATAVGQILEGIANSGLEADEICEAEETGKAVLNEVVKEEPDKGVIKRSLTMLKGMLSPVAIGAQDGVTDAAQETAKEWASTGIKALIAAAALLV